MVVTLGNLLLQVEKTCTFMGQFISQKSKILRNLKPYSGGGGGGGQGAGCVQEAGEERAGAGRNGKIFFRNIEP